MSRRDLGLLLVLSAIWAPFLFIKVGVDEPEPAVVAFGRLAVGFLVLLPIGLRGREIPDVRRLGGVPRPGHAQQRAPVLAHRLRRDADRLGARGRDPGGVADLHGAARDVDRPEPTGPRCASWASASAFSVLLLVGVQEGELVGALAVVGTALCYALAVLYAAAPCAASRRCSVDRPAGGRHAARHAFRAAAAAVRGTLGEGGRRDRGPRRRHASRTLYFALIARAGASRAILVTYLVPAFALGYGAVPRRGHRVGIGGLALHPRRHRARDRRAAAPWVAWRGEPVLDAPAAARRDLARVVPLHQGRRRGRPRAGADDVRPGGARGRRAAGVRRGRAAGAGR